jgi:hypothetical protein
VPEHGSRCFDWEVEVTPGRRRKEGDMHVTFVLKAGAKQTLVNVDGYPVVVSALVTNLGLGLAALDPGNTTLTTGQSILVGTSTTLTAENADKEDTLLEVKYSVVAI